MGGLSTGQCCRGSPELWFPRTLGQAPALSSEFPCRAARSHARERGSTALAPRVLLHCRTTGILESHYCLPHTGTHISQPEDLGIRWKGRSSSLPTRES